MKQEQTVHLKRFIKKALQEDVGAGDHTSLACIAVSRKAKAQLLVKENGIVAGVELAKIIFSEVDKKLAVKIVIEDGESVKKGDVVLFVEGNAQSILKAERLVLNCMQRMSGIATATNKLVKLCSGTKAKVVDTRKTTPGFRQFEKWAVEIGGGTNHRFGLYDMILIKDNHIDYAGGIKNAIASSKNYIRRNNLKLEIEIEARSISELKEIIFVGGVDRIMLDNFSISELKKAVKLIGNKYVTEASGGITEETIRSYALCGVDFISVGALTHSVNSLDLSLKATR